MILSATKNFKFQSNSVSFLKWPHFVVTGLAVSETTLTSREIEIALEALLIPIRSQVGDHVKNEIKDAFEFLLFFYNNLFLQGNFVVTGVLVLQLGLFHLLLHELKLGALVLHELNQKVHMVSLYHFSLRKELTDIGNF